MQKNTKIFLILFTLALILFIVISPSNAIDINDTASNDLEVSVNNIDPSSELINKITSANDGDEILIEPGTYYIHDLVINKNITLQGNGNPRDVIFDGEKLGSILLTRSNDAYLTIKNITFINGLTYNFGGAISMETGHVYVDNCIFINNTALGLTNAGGISNYGTEECPAYLLVNNSLFMNNFADHDGGAITTCKATSDIYNSVFINNSAFRDGGAIRVSLYGYGNVVDCIFMYNYAREWGGAYYSWACNSNLERCIFMNNTAGTNGGAVMVSGNLTLTKSIIVNNTSYQTGGSFYIQNPMFEASTVIDVHDNLITNNTSPLGKEIYMDWEKPKMLFTKFNGNDWGDEDPTDSSVIDPDHVTQRSKVTSTIKSNLLNELNLDLLNNYVDLIEDNFPEDYFKKSDDDNNNNNHNQNNNNHDQKNKNDENNNPQTQNQENTGNLNVDNQNSTKIEGSSQETKISTNTPNNQVAGNSTSYGDNKKAYEINESKSVEKSTTFDVRYFIGALIIIFLLLFIGYRRKSNLE